MRYAASSNRRARAALATAVVLGAVTVYSCGDPAPTEPPASVPTTVTVTPGEATLDAIEATVQFAATVSDQFGSEMETAQVMWSTSDATVATVDAAGLVAAVANGTVTVTAASGSASGSAAVTIDQIAAQVELYPKQTIFLPFFEHYQSPILIDLWDANGNPLAPDQYERLVWRSSDEGVATVALDGEGPNATVFGVGHGATTISATVDGVVATTEVLFDPLEFDAEFAQTAPTGAPVIIGRPGIFRVYFVAAIGELKRGPKVEVIFSGRSLGVAELNRPVPKSFNPDSLDVSLNYRIEGRRINANELDFSVKLIATVGSDHLPLNGDLRDTETHYVVPISGIFYNTTRRTYSDPDPIWLFVRPIVQHGNINYATIAQADSLASVPILHEKWRPLIDATSMAGLYLDEEGPLYVSHDPDDPGNMSRTLGALVDAWEAECYWFFGTRCPEWHYFGVTGLPDWWGIARTGSVGGSERGFAAISGWHGWTIAHEVAHLILLKHAPGNCGARNVDERYRPLDGSIGVTPGYIFGGRGVRVVPRGKKDYMGYCRDRGQDPPVWVSRYHFWRAHRNLGALAQRRADREEPRVTGRIDRVLVIGGGRYDGALELDPAIVVQGHPVLPSAPGPYELTGVDARGDVVFRRRFDMDWYWDSPTGDGSFRIAIPASPAWSQTLERIVLRGPEGLREMGRDTEEPKTWVLDANMGLVRSLLRGADALAELQREMRSAGGGESLVVITSRGIPDETQWTRDWRVAGPTTAADARRAPVLVRRRR